MDRNKILRAANDAADCHEAFRDALAKLRALQRKHNLVLEELGQDDTVAEYVEVLSDMEVVLDDLPAYIEELADEQVD